MEAGAKFCPKCGAAASSTAAGAASSASPVSAAPAGPAQGGGALKIILIVLAVIVGLGILSMGTCAFMVRRALHRMHVREHDGNVHVETPFGTVDSTEDPNEAARNVGVDLYPGATVAKEGSANMTIGSMHTATVTLDTSDPPSAINDFYKSKFPNANVMTSQGDRYTIVSGDKNNMITINIEARDGKTRIRIAKVTGMTGTSSN
jgi:hypothetical protein